MHRTVFAALSAVHWAFLGTRQDLSSPFPVPFLPNVSSIYTCIPHTNLNIASRMEYQPLYSKLSNGIYLKDSNYRSKKTVHTDSVHGITKSKPRFYPWTHCLLLYSAILTTLLAVLLATMLITHVHGNLDIRAHRAANTSTFGRDFRFMSVDHNYDGLWEDWDFNDDNADDKHAVLGGMVTMSVVPLAKPDRNRRITC